MPREDRLSVRSFADYSAHYARMGNLIPDWVEAERDPSRYRMKSPWLPVDREARILDFGCGWGGLLLQLWCTGYRNLDGVEVSESQFAVAQRQAAGRVRLYLADGQDFLGSASWKYDVVILSDVIEHVPASETQDLLTRIRGGLREGGRIVVRTPNMSSLLASYSRYIDRTHVCGFTEYSLMQFLDGAGFGNHRFTKDDWGLSLRGWRPWAPWRGTGLIGLANHCLHEALYRLREQKPRPKRFGYNLEVYSDAM